MNETWWVNSGDLDTDQKTILKSDADDDLLIIGPPGCGKTNILMLRANYVRSVHPRLHFLTFTRTLTEFLRSGPNVGRDDQIKASEISTFYAWGCSILRNSGIDVPKKTGNFNKDRRALSQALENYITVNNPGILYDVIIVDEVQDFWARELDIIRRFTTHMNAAGDSRQAIWGHREGLPRMQSLSTKIVNLRYHYRIGRNICIYADRILPPKIGEPEMISGCKYDEKARPSSISTISCSNIDDQYRICLNNIKNQLRYIVDEPILVISHQKETRDGFWKTLEADGDLLPRAVLQSSDGYEAFGPQSLVRVMTIASAKGSESRAVHLLNAGKLTDSLRELAFTGVTRAKTEVTLYHSGGLPGHLQPPAQTLPDLDDIF